MSAHRVRMPALTLVELLVVAAIIALLISLLLPSLRAGRHSAQAAVCAAHLRQIGVGWTLYADQYDGSIVPGRPGKFPDTDNLYFVGNGRHYRPRWYVQMGAQAGLFAFDRPSPSPAEDNTKTVDNRVFLCPSRPQWINNRNYPFGYNFQFLGNARFKGDDSANGFINFPAKIHHLSRLSFTVLAADTLGTAATYPENQRRGYRVDGLDVRRALGNHGWSLDPPRLTKTGDFCNNKYRREARSGPDPRHLQRSNFLFGDAHLERLKPEEVGYIVRPDGSYPLPDDPLNDQAHNRRFSGTGADSDPPVVE